MRNVHLTTVHITLRPYHGYLGNVTLLPILCRSNVSVLHFRAKPDICTPNKVYESSVNPNFFPKVRFPPKLSDSCAYAEVTSKANITFLRVAISSNDLEDETFIRGRNESDRL